VGVDAIEVSGGMWECLVRPEKELGFRPVPMAESHTRIKNPEKQSYFLKYAERLDLSIPVILVGGNRDVERLEQILQDGKVDFISLCRPLICEPDLPNRWLEGRGGSHAECISCNSCIYVMWTGLEEGRPGAVQCVYKQDREQVKQAQKWLSNWVTDNVCTRDER
jgi:2,4-dienoyl-CoA reductase-like NADH-dependent reductase (Old Yellow Enzyme family)